MGTSPWTAVLNYSLSSTMANYTQTDLFRKGNNQWIKASRQQTLLMRTILMVLTKTINIILSKKNLGILCFHPIAISSTKPEHCSLHKPLRQVYLQKLAIPLTDPTPKFWHALNVFCSAMC